MNLTTRLGAVGLYLALSFLQISCAKVGDPLPPPVQAPPTPAAVRLIQEGGRFVHLAFSPTSNDIAQIELYRACGTEEFNDPLITVPAQQATQRLDGSLQITDDQPLPGSTCRYALRFVDSRNNPSSRSGILQTSQEVPPLPPTGLRAEVEEDEIILRWNPPDRNVDGDPVEGPVSYLINSQVLVNEPVYRDSEFKFGQPVTYRVQAVTRQQDPIILSEPGETVTLAPRDVFPPEAPENVSAVLVAEGVQLLWDVVKNGDLEGYFIYRGSDREKLERVSPIVKTNRYLDQAIPTGEQLFYQVTAVDQDGNEGDRSEVVSVRPSQ